MRLVMSRKVGIIRILRGVEVESAFKPVINLQLAKPLIGLFHLVVKG